MESCNKARWVFLFLKKLSERILENYRERERETDTAVVFFKSHRDRESWKKWISFRCFLNTVWLARKFRIYINFCVCDKTQSPTNKVGFAFFVLLFSLFGTLSAIIVFVEIRPTRNVTQSACGERSTWVGVGVTFLKKVVIRWGPADVGPYLQRIVYIQLRRLDGLINDVSCVFIKRVGWAESLDLLGSVVLVLYAMSLTLYVFPFSP